jgi:hypothetical protein
MLFSIMNFTKMPKIIDKGIYCFDSIIPF